MSEPQQLREIANSLKNLVRVIEALNHNFMEVGRAFKTWIEIADEEPTLSEVHEDVQKIQDLVHEMNTKQREESREVDIVTEDVLGEGEVRLQRPDRFNDYENSHGEE